MFSRLRVQRVIGQRLHSSVAKDGAKEGPVAALLHENVATAVGSWPQAMQRVKPDQLSRISEIRRRYEELRSQLALLSMQAQEDSKVATTIDSYAASLPADSPVRAKISELKQKWLSYSEQSAPAASSAHHEIQAKLEAIEAQKLADLREGEEFLAAVREDMQVVQSYLTRLEKMPPYDTITVQEYFALFPEIKEQVFKEIQEDDNWGRSTESKEEAASKQISSH